MSQMQEVRSFYLDSQWTQRNANGSFSLILDEQIEVANSQVILAVPSMAQSLLLAKWKRTSRELRGL